MAEPAVSTRRSSLAVLVLGVNAWGIGLLWPLLAGGGDVSERVVRSLACLLPLVLGVAASELTARTSRLRALPALLWLAVYPAAFAAELASRPEVHHQRIFGPFALVLLWGALCAYGAAALAACRQRSPELCAVYVPLGNEPWDAPPKERSRLQGLVIALCATGAAAIALLAPSLGGYSALREAWGDSARAGGVLAAVVGAALAVSVVAVFLGTALRAESGARTRPREAPFQTAWFLFLALLSLVTYFVVQP